MSRSDRIYPQLHDHVAEGGAYSPVAIQQRMERAIDKQAKRSKSAPDFLTAAIGHMEDRAKTYDKPAGERSMAATVAAFNAATGHAVTEEQGWLFMVFLKAIRTQQGVFRADNYEDGAAYFGLMGESAVMARELSE